jgi:hypothetical protein
VPNNSATRLSEVAHEIWKIAGSDPAVRVWPRVLDVSGFDGWKKNVEIARMVGLCRQQVDGLRRDIEAAPQGARYEWVLKPLEGMFSYDEPSNRWDSTVRAHLNDGLLATLKTLGDFLPETVGPVPPKALESARSLVARIRKAVMAAELPDVVRQFLLGQVELMERGFREFPLRGPEAFRASRDAAAVEWFTAPPALLPYTNDRVVKKIHVGWRRLRLLAEVYGGLSAVAGGTHYMIGVAEQFGLIPPGAAQVIERVLDPGSTPKGLGLPDGYRLLLPGDPMPPPSDGPGGPRIDPMPPPGDGPAVPPAASET